MALLVCRGFFQLDQLLSGLRRMLGGGATLEIPNDLGDVMVRLLEGLIEIITHAVEESVPTFLECFQPLPILVPSGFSFGAQSSGGALFGFKLRAT